MDRANRSRRRGAAGHATRLHNPEQPAGARRDALFRLDSIGTRRNALLRPARGKRVPHLGVDVRIVRSRADRRRQGRDDHLRFARIPSLDTILARGSAPRGVFETASRHSEPSAAELEHDQSRHRGAERRRHRGFGRRAASGAPLPQGAAPLQLPQLGAAVVRSILARRGRREPQFRRDGHDSEPALHDGGILHLRLERRRRIGVEGLAPLPRAGSHPQRERHLWRPPEHISRLRLQSRDPCHRVSRGSRTRQVLLRGRVGVVPAHVPTRLPHPLPHGVGFVGVLQRPRGQHGQTLRRRGRHQQRGHHRLQQRSASHLVRRRISGYDAHVPSRLSAAVGLRGLGLVRRQPRRRQPFHPLPL